MNDNKIRAFLRTNNNVFHVGSVNRSLFNVFMSLSDQILRKDTPYNHYGMFLEPDMYRRTLSFLRSVDVINNSTKNFDKVMFTMSGIEYTLQMYKGNLNIIFPYLIASKVEFKTEVHKLHFLKLCYLIEYDN